MKAEIGFDDCGKPYVVLTPKSPTELALLKHVAKQLGIKVVEECNEAWLYPRDGSS